MHYENAPASGSRSWMWGRLRLFTTLDSLTQNAGVNRRKLAMDMELLKRAAGYLLYTAIFYLVFAYIDRLGGQTTKKRSNVGTA
jgi:hypothetical protein